MIPVASMIPRVVRSEFIDSHLRAPRSIYRMPGLSVQLELEPLAAPGQSKIHIYTSRVPVGLEADEIRELVHSIMAHHRLVGVR